jgi:ATP-dependent DNA ligase
MLCLGAERLPEGREWRYELKLDGFRAIGRKAGRSAQLWSRNRKNFARRFPAVVKALADLPDDTIIDGEVVVSINTAGRRLTSYKDSVREPAASCCMRSIC